MDKKFIIIDTSILLELLNVPHKASDTNAAWSEFKRKSTAGCTFFIPLAAIFETGNHIAQNGDGRQRLACAKQFVDFIEKAMNGNSPFQFLEFFDKNELQKWLSEFPDWSKRGQGFGDLSICKDLQQLHIRFPREDIAIWSLDGHLDAYAVQGER